MDTFIKHPFVQHLLMLLIMSLGIWLMLSYFTNIISYNFFEVVLILVSVRAAKFYVFDVP